MIEQITLEELKKYIEYAKDVDILKHHFCRRGEVFFLRKAHLKKELGVSIGNDVLIVNPIDYYEANEQIL